MTQEVFNNTLIMKTLNKYLKSNRQEKGIILNNLEETTGLHRKSLIRKLNREQRYGKRYRGGSMSKYHAQTSEILALVWQANDYICAERMHSQIEYTVANLKRHGYLDELEQVAIEQVLKIPLGTLKNKLRGIPRQKVMYSHSAKSGKELQKKVAINTELSKAVKSGYLGIDFVDHNGGDCSGKFGRTLAITDPYNHWTVKSTVLGRDKLAVEMAMKRNKEKIPFMIKELHSDNEPGLLSVLLDEYAKTNKIAISRSRSYKKEDNSNVEQKNGDKVRNLVGYFRYDKPEEIELLNEIFDIDDILQNHFIASMKLKEKVYNEGGKLIKRIYDEAKTPYQRIMSDKSIDVEVKLKLAQVHVRLDRLRIKEERDKLIRKLFRFR